MQLRNDIVELLRAGASDRAIGQQLHCDPRIVSATRAALGLPKSKSGRKPAASIAELFYARTEPVDGGHLRWTGYRNDHGVPALRYSRRTYSAYATAFRIKTGRDPVGNVIPQCAYPGCVHPDHVDDRPAREHNRSAYSAIFGEADQR